jgi:hypothetical protein
MLSAVGTPVLIMTAAVGTLSIDIALAVDASSIVVAGAPVAVGAHAVSIIRVSTSPPVKSCFNRIEDSLGCHFTAAYPPLLKTPITKYYRIINPGCGNAKRGSKYVPYGIIAHGWKRKRS